MSSLWDVEVVDLTETTVRLRVVSIHPDAGPFRCDATFVLRLLYDTAQELDDDFEYRPAGPLGEAVRMEQTFSESWMEANAGRFVASVRIEEDDVDLEAPLDAAATYRVEATDAKWLGHLEKSRRWDSAAY